MAPICLDPREVLCELNKMGYRNISAEQLKEFMQDLKRLILYEYCHSPRPHFQKPVASPREPTSQYHKNCIHESASSIQRQPQRPGQSPRSPPSRSPSSRSACSSQCRDAIAERRRGCVPSSSATSPKRQSRASFAIDCVPIPPRADPTDPRRRCRSASTTVAPTVLRLPAYPVDNRRSTLGVGCAPIRCTADRSVSANLPVRRTCVEPAAERPPPLLVRNTPCDLYRFYANDWHRFRDQMPGQSSRESVRLAVRQSIECAAGAQQRKPKVFLSMGDQRKTIVRR